MPLGEPLKVFQRGKLIAMSTCQKQNTETTQGSEGIDHHIKQRGGIRIHCTACLLTHHPRGNGQKHESHVRNGGVGKDALEIGLDQRYEIANH